MDERTRYSDEELQEFRELILEKLQAARQDYERTCATMSNSDGNDDSDTAPIFKPLEEGATTLAKETHAQVATNQQKYIRSLEQALVRIENKTYGICVVTGKLIPKERLKAVPNTTKTVEAKNRR